MLLLVFRLGVLDALLDRLDGLVLVREVLELLSGGGAGGAFQVVDERLESLLDDGCGDLLVLVGLVAADLLGGLDGLGQRALGFGDGRLQRLDGVDLGLEVLGDEVVIGDERVCQPWRRWSSGRSGSAATS